MAGKRPQETGHSHGNDRVPPEREGNLRVGGPDKARKRQPELPSEQKNGKGSKQGIRLAGDRPLVKRYTENIVF
jgi:hypothetical protein